MYSHIRQAFLEQFGHPAQFLFSAPGRTELGGNHTDHQHGCVLAAAVNRAALAAVAENGTRTIRLLSEGYPMCRIDLDDLEARPSEFGRTAALIRGVAARFADCGIRGFDAYVTSTVLPGSGLSSSAAFEVLLGTVLNHLFHEGRTAAEIAMIGQYAENVYFGKPCGLMDQMASSVGNIIGIDFADPENPLVTPIAFDFSQSGYSLCVVNSGGSHADMTDEYAAIPGELRQVCAVFGKTYLRDVPEDAFYDRLPEVRRAVGDRGVLRAIHVMEDNKRVARQIKALQRGDFAAFLRDVTESGLSSWRYLQNVVPAGQTKAQDVAVALAVAEKLLAGSGACRVHGGGFAGTIQAFVPQDRVPQFRAGMEAVTGEGSCHILSIRKEGGVLLEDWR